MQAYLCPRETKRQAKIVHILEVVVAVAKPSVSPTYDHELDELNMLCKLLPNPYLEKFEEFNFFR